MRSLLGFLFVVACGNTYVPDFGTVEEADEAMVTTFEQMGELARENPPCERWSDESNRRWGARRLNAMIERLATFDEARKQAFKAKYGKRIEKAIELVVPFAERCITELKSRP